MSSMAKEDPVSASTQGRSLDNEDFRRLCGNGRLLDIVGAARKISAAVQCAPDRELADFLKKLVTENSYPSAEIFRDVLNYLAPTPEERLTRLHRIFDSEELTRLERELHERFHSACNRLRGSLMFYEDRAEEIKGLWGFFAPPPIDESDREPRLGRFGIDAGVREVNMGLLYFESLHSAARHGSPYRRDPEDRVLNQVLASIPSARELGQW